MKEKLNSNKLIAVSGVKGSGKDVVSKMIQYCLSVPKIFRQYWIYKLIGPIVPKKYKLLAFADPVKKVLATLLNAPVKNFYNRDFKENYVINIATLDTPVVQERLSDSKFNRLVKSLDPSLLNANLTIRQLMQYVATEIFMKYFGKRVWINCTFRHAVKNTIITDLRFKEEYNAVKEKDGVVIYVNRPEYKFGQHASEKEMEELLWNNKYDYVINNSGNLKQLFNKIKNVF